jgi:cysteine-rich repeat protein
VIPVAAYDPSGRLFVAWQPASIIFTPRGRAYDPTGRALHAPFALAEEPMPALILAARPDGRFAEGWRKGNYDLKMQVQSLCVPPYHTGCGDGVVTAPCEKCDAGPANSDSAPDTCRTTCALPSCGDGVTDHNEACDDGNRRGCDGCDASCNLEPGYVCGDGTLSTDCKEQCDDGPGNDDTLPNACRTDCRVAHCGDGVIDDGEGCDDGNLTSCDGCSDLCVPEPGLVCGDGIPELLCGEECDDGNTIVGDGCRMPCRLERIPGGGSPTSDCHVEWVVDNPANAPFLDKFGAINGVQTCTDGDPRCDFDGVAGTCTFHVRVCANNTDLPSCTPGSRLRSWELRAPSVNKAAKRPDMAAVRDAFATVPGSIVGPDRTDICSETLAVPIKVKTSASGTKAGSLVLKSHATLYTGQKDSDKLTLICLP